MTGPRPGAPRNITVQEVDNGFVITWEPPLEKPELVRYYTIMYRMDSTWKELNKRGGIRADETKYLGKIIREYTTLRKHYMCPCDNVLNKIIDFLLRNLL